MVEDEFEGVTELSYEVEAKPITIFTFIRFLLTVLMGITKTFLVAFDQVNDDVVGAEGYKNQRREFHDQVREDLETIPAVEE